MNRVEFIGRLTKDNEIKVTQSNAQILNNSIAVTRNRKNKQTGEYDTDFFNFTAFNQTAELLQRFTQKGDQVGISGRLQQRQYQAQDGSNRQSIDIIVDDLTLLDNGRRQNDNQNNNNSYQQNQQSYPQQENNPFANSKGAVDIDDDSLPF